MAKVWINIMSKNKVIREVVVNRVTLREWMAINQEKPMNKEVNRLSVGRFKVMSKMGIQVVKMNRMESLAIIINKEEYMDMGVTVQDKVKYVNRLGMEKFVMKSGREVMEDMTNLLESLVVNKVTDKSDMDMDKYREEEMEMENFVIDQQVQKMNIFIQHLLQQVADQQLL